MICVGASLVIRVNDWGSWTLFVIKDITMYIFNEFKCILIYDEYWDTKSYGGKSYSKIYSEVFQLEGGRP